MIPFVSYRTSIGTLNLGSRGAGTYLFERGTQPTVIDANLLLGEGTKRPSLGCDIHLDRERAMRMMRAQKGSSATLEEFATGILRVIDVWMSDLAIYHSSRTETVQTMRCDGEVHLQGRISLRPDGSASKAIP